MRAREPTPVFLPGEPQGQRSLVGYSPWGRKELDTTEQLSTHASYSNLEDQAEEGWEKEFTSRIKGLFGANPIHDEYARKLSICFPGSNLES